MRKLIYPILFFAIAVVGFFWYVEPTYSETQDIKQQISEYDETLSQITKLQEQLNQKLEKRDAITSSEFTRLDRIFPSTVDTVRFLIEIDRIAAQHGMSVEDASFSGAPARFGGADDNSGSGGGEEGDRAYNTLTTSFSVSGSYQDVQNFMRDIEQSSRLLDVTEFTLTTPSTDEEQAAGLGGINEYSFSLQTYWRNQNAL